jgi:hypothetical protein
MINDRLAVKDVKKEAMPQKTALANLVTSCTAPSASATRKN